MKNAREKALGSIASIVSGGAFSYLFDAPNGIDHWWRGIAIVAALAGYYFGATHGTSNRKRAWAGLASAATACIFLVGYNTILDTSAGGLLAVVGLAASFFVGFAALFFLLGTIQFRGFVGAFTGS